MNIQSRFHLGLTGLISLLSKGLSGVFSNYNSKASILWHSAFFMVQLSHLYMIRIRANISQFLASILCGTETLIFLFIHLFNKLSLTTQYVTFPLKYHCSKKDRLDPWPHRYDDLKHVHKFNSPPMKPLAPAGLTDSLLIDWMQWKCHCVTLPLAEILYSFSLLFSRMRVLENQSLCFE